MQCVVNQPYPLPIGETNGSLSQSAHYLYKDCSIEISDANFHFISTAVFYLFPMGINCTGNTISLVTLILFFAIFILYLSTQTETHSFIFFKVFYS